jgi:membrane protease YdiL (CAAX protease family)
MATTSFLGRLWRAAPLVVRAIACGLVVLAIGILPWPVLVTTNLSFGASVPWSVPVMAAYLSACYVYLSGWGWPQSTSASRRCALRAGPVSPPVWFWSLLAGGSAAAGLVGLFFVSLRLGQVPPAAFDKYLEMRQYSAWTVIPCLVMSAVVAGAVEEAGFRGYMQSALERRYGPAVAMAIVSVVFFLAHFAPLAALPGFVLGAVTWGLLAYLTGSIWPGVVLHSLVDTTSFLWAWSDPEQGKRLAMSRVWETGIDRNFCVSAGGALVLAACSVPAFWMLARVTRTGREEQRRTNGGHARF